MAMELSRIEFFAMNTALRRLGQRRFELPIFCRMGLDVHNRDVLEIGCGSGYGAFLLGRQKPRSYVGLDVMPEQIELARRDYPQYDFRVQDATNLSDFDSGSRDVVVIFGVLHHIPAWRQALDEIVRVLRPDGHFFIEEPRGVELRMFDFIFRWGHPETDFGLKTFERYCVQRGLNLIQKQWTPLLSMYHWQKGWN